MKIIPMHFVYNIPIVFIYIPTDYYNLFSEILLFSDQRKHKILTFKKDRPYGRSLLIINLLDENEQAFF